MGQPEKFRSTEPTDRDWPPTLGDPVLAVIRRRALALAQSKIGEQESGPNEGPIVDWAIEDFTDRAAGPWAHWCAGFACRCYLQALMDSYAEVRTAADDRAGKIASLIAGWKQVASLSCTVLLEGCAARGWTIADPADVQPGDLCFVFKSGDSDPYHVGMVEQIDVSRQIVATIDGNSGSGADRVARNVRHLDEATKTYRFVRPLSS